MKIEITPEMLNILGDSDEGRARLGALLAVIERDYALRRRWVAPLADPARCGAVSPSGRMVCHDVKGHGPGPRPDEYVRHFGLSAVGARRAWREWL